MIQRFSCYGDDLYVPFPAGRWAESPYLTSQIIGAHGRITKPFQLEMEIGFWAGFNPEIPITVMVHGYEFDPKSALGQRPQDTNNPHGRLYHFEQQSEEIESRTHATSWPLMLGYANDIGESGLCIGYGWYSNPSKIATLWTGKNSYVRAYELGTRAGVKLQELLATIYATWPETPINILCHSLGSHVVCEALNDSSTPIKRVVFLEGAEYSHLAKKTIESKPATEFYNFVTKTDDILAKFGDNFGPEYAATMGNHGVKVDTDNLLNLQLDDQRLIDWGNINGYNLCGDNPNEWADHWECYTHKGNQDLIRHFLKFQTVHISDWRSIEIPQMDLPQ